MDFGWLAGTLGAAVAEGQRALLGGLQVVEQQLLHLDHMFEESGSATAGSDGASAASGAGTASCSLVNADSLRSDDGIPITESVIALGRRLAAGTVDEYAQVFPTLPRRLDAFELSPAQQRHALDVLMACEQLAQFRYRATKHDLSDAAFWALYFAHLERHNQADQAAAAVADSPSAQEMPLSATSTNEQPSPSLSPPLRPKAATPPPKRPASKEEQLLQRLPMSPTDEYLLVSPADALRTDPSSAASPAEPEDEWTLVSAVG